MMPRLLSDMMPQVMMPRLMNRRTPSIKNGLLKMMKEEPNMLNSKLPSDMLISMMRPRLDSKLTCSSGPRINIPSVLNLLKV